MSSLSKEVKNLRADLTQANVHLLASEEIEDDLHLVSCYISADTLFYVITNSFQF